jgi:hypothetical protein
VHFLRAVFRFAQKTPFKEIYWGEHVLKKKIEDFFLQNMLAPKKYLRPPFERSEK